MPELVGIESDDLAQLRLGEFRLLGGQQQLRIDLPQHGVVRTGLEGPLEQRERWLADLRALWSDVKPGDNVTTVVVPGQATHFYDERGRMGQIDDPEFGPAFLSIWLDSRSVVRNLRVQLLGVERSNARR